MDELHVEDPDASPETAPSEIDVERGLPPRLAEALLNLGVNELRCVGQARNWRTVGSVEGLDGQLELDRLELPSGEIVFEAEIESENHSTHGAWASWIQRIAPTAHQSVLSKAERVIRALDTAEVR